VARAPRARGFVGTAVLTALVTSMVAGGAGAAEPLRVVVTNEAAPSWPARAQGQLADLTPVKVELWNDSGSEEETGSTTPCLATCLQVQLVTGSSTNGSTLLRLVSVEAPPYVVTVGGNWQRLSAAARSTTLEAAALALRSAVRARLLALSQDSDPGRDTPDAPGATETPTATLAPVPVLPEPGPDADSTAHPDPNRVHWGVLIAGGLVLDGQTSPAIPSLKGALSARAGVWGWRLGLWWRPPARAELPGAELRLSRLGLDLESQIHLNRTWRLQPFALLQLGALREQRRTRTQSAEVLPTARARHDSVWLGAGGGVLYPVSTHHRLETFATVGRELPQTRHVLRSATGTATRTLSASTVPIRLSLGWLWDW
jgi:hypothetical protein